VYAFGDDHSDNGNYSKNDQEWPSDINWEGRLSNGPLAVEVMAEQLNVDLTDYAYCAAMSDQDSIQFSNAGLLGQVDKFEAELNGGKADPEALYFIEIGMVDFYMLEVSTSANRVVANIVTAVTRLAELGAKHFMVGNSFILSKFPGFSGNATQAEMFQTKMNAALPGEMDKLAQEMGLEIEIFDFTATEERIRSNPDQYGITHLQGPCTYLPMDDSAEICDNPDEYYYWGYYYLTHHVHQILGEAMASQVSD
jgi:phospholipase/lecithinase/hemolysin